MVSIIGIAGREDKLKSRILSVAISAGLLFATGARAEPVLQGKEAYGDWQADKPGTVRLIRPQDLVRPHPR